MQLPLLPPALALQNLSTALKLIPDTVHNPHFIYRNWSVKRSAAHDRLFNSLGHCS